MAESHPNIQGACYCGAVSVTVPAPLEQPVNCHCGQCRRLSGAAFTTWLTAPRSATRVTGADSLTTFRPTENLERHFCKLCGSHVHTADRRLPDVYGFPAGLFEGSVIEAPRRDYFFKDKATWYQTP